MGYLIKKTRRNFLIEKLKILEKLSFLYQENPCDLMVQLKMKRKEVIDKQIKFIRKSLKTNHNDYYSNDYINDKVKEIQERKIVLCKETRKSLFEKNEFKHLMNSYYNGKNAIKVLNKSIPPQSHVNFDRYNGLNNLDISFSKNYDIINDKNFKKYVTSILGKSVSLKFRYRLLIISALILTFYLFILYFISNFIQQKANYDIFLSNTIWNNDQEILKNSISMNTILILNKTEANFSFFSIDDSGNDKSLTYIQELDELFQKINYMFKIIKENSDFQNIQKYFKNYVDCNLIYSDFYNDNIYTKFNEKFKINKNIKDYMYNNLKIVCQTFHEMEAKDFMIFYDNLNILNRNIFLNFQK